MQHLGTILTPTSTRSIKEGLFPAAARQDAGMSADGRLWSQRWEANPIATYLLSILFVVSSYRIARAAQHLGSTYYDFAGHGDDLRRYWERMTKVRLEFLPDPGPVGAAVRTGLDAAGLMIEVDAIAVVG
jgi:hypothetical protein